MASSLRYKALILDLDGTSVLFGQNDVSPGVIAAVASLRERGIPVCVASGRALNSALPIIEQLKPCAPCVLTDGAVMYDPESRQILEEICLSEEQVRGIQLIIKPEDCKISYYTKTEELDLNQGDAIQHPITGFCAYELEKAQAEQFQQVLSQDPTLTLRIITKTYSGKLAFAITHIKATKQQALLQILKRLNIPPEEIVAIGDGENDMPMILAAGMGIAMGNAVQSLKDVADDVTLNVEEDGVAAAIYKYFPLP